MQETIKRHLSYKEELALAAFFSNVEKFKCLADMPLFSKGLLTEPFHTRETDRAPLATILSCLKILYDLPGHEDLKGRNDAIIEIVRKKTGLIIDESADLSEYTPSGSGNILGISDYKRLYSWILQFRAKGYSQGEEDWSTLLCKYDYAVNNALREQHLKRLECELSDEELIQARGEAESDEKERKDSFAYHRRPLPEEVKAFIDSIDAPGTVLALFDEGKAFARIHTPEPPVYLYEDIVRYILTATRHIVIRVGGYSYRVAALVLNIARCLNSGPWRVEYLSDDSDVIDNAANIPFATVFPMHRYHFAPESPFVKIAMQYDYKCFSMGGEFYPMVYYYVNKIDTGFYREDGSFAPFYSKERGLQALTDVAMVLGYEDIRPAAAALYSDSGNGRGDMLFFGPTAHSNKKSCGSSQRKLFEDADIKFFNLNDIKRD